MTNHILTAIVIGLAGAAPLARQQNISNRPTDANALIAGSKGLYDGTFKSPGTSSVCGEIPKMASLTGEDTFVIEFSGGEKPGEVTSITFGSKDLVRGATTSSLFSLNITVVTSNGGRPYAYKLHTDEKKPGESGTATLVQKGKATTLTVRGQNDMKETITLIVTCG
jgi:hypothetical protein